MRKIKPPTARKRFTPSDYLKPEEINLLHLLRSQIVHVASLEDALTLEIKIKAILRTAYERKRQDEGSRVGSSKNRGHITFINPKFVRSRNRNA